MRIFLITALILFDTAFSIVAAGPARAQDLNLGLGSTSREEAIQESQKFFNQCLRRPIIDLSETTDQAFCACSASNLQQWLETPATRTSDMEFFESPNKELTKPVLLSQVYGPCLYIPVYELTYRDCVTDDDNAWSAQTEQELTGLCTCMAAGDESYFRDFGQAYLEMLYADGADFDDPIEEIKRSNDFYVAHHQIQTNCYQDLRRARGD